MPLITERAIEITAQKMKFPLRISSVSVTKSLVTFNEEILNGKLHFLCSALFCDEKLFIIFHYLCIYLVRKNNRTSSRKTHSLGMVGCRKHSDLPFNRSLIFYRLVYNTPVYFSDVV